MSALFGFYTNPSLNYVASSHRKTTYIKACYGDFLLISNNGLVLGKFRPASAVGVVVLLGKLALSGGKLLPKLVGFLAGS